jgi:hypothetical protein
MVGEPEDDYYDERAPEKEDSFYDERRLERLEKIKITDANNEEERDYDNWYQVFDDFPILEKYTRYFNEVEPNPTEVKIFDIEREYSNKLRVLENQYYNVTGKWPFASVHVYTNIDAIDDRINNNKIYEYQPQYRTYNLFKDTYDERIHPSGFDSLRPLNDDEIIKMINDPNFDELIDKNEQIFEIPKKYKEYLQKGKEILLQFYNEKNKLNIQ